MKNTLNSDGIMSVKEFKKFRKEMDMMGVQIKFDTKSNILKGDVQAGYDPKTKTIYLKKPPKVYDALHESFHAKHHNLLGEDKYNNLSRVQKERYVYEQILKNKDKLTDKNLNHAEAYIYKLENNLFDWPPKNEEGMYILK